LRHDQRVAEACVEALGDVAHQLDVLALVLADRDLVGAVREHVGGLEHWVEEEPGGDQLALVAGLLPELVHAVELAVGRDGAQQPAQARCARARRTGEEDAALRIEAGREQQRRRVVDALAQLARVVADGGRVQVDDAVDRLAAVLPGDVLDDRPEVVAEVLRPVGWIPERCGSSRRAVAPATVIAAGG